jgi:hypothetical protein
LVPYEWTQQARVLYSAKLEGLARVKHTSLMDLFVSFFSDKNGGKIFFLGSTLFV